MDHSQIQYIVAMVDDGIPHHPGINTGWYDPPGRGPDIHHSRNVVTVQPDPVFRYDV